MKKIMISVIVVTISTYNSAMQKQTAAQPILTNKRVLARSNSPESGIFTMHEDYKKNGVVVTPKSVVQTDSWKKEVPHSYIFTRIMVRAAGSDKKSSTSSNSGGSESPVTVSGSPESCGPAVIEKLSPEKVIEYALASSPKVSGLAIALKTRQMQTSSKAGK